MSTKSERRRNERRKEATKAMEALIKNPTEPYKYLMGTYGFYGVLYLNDVVFNLCKDVERELHSLDYKDKGAQKICGALSKRMDNYFDIIKEPLLDRYSLAALFGEIDDYMDQRVSEVAREIENVLVGYSISNAHWLACCETTHLLCRYAIQINEMFQSAGIMSDDQRFIVGLANLTEILGILDSLCHFAIVVGHVRDNINLNQHDKVLKAFKRLDKAFLDGEKFSNAMNAAQTECEKNNWRPLI